MATPGTGQVNTAELGAVMTSLGQHPTEAELQGMINAVDANQNGKVDFQEFTAMMNQKGEKPDPEQELKDAFKTFDIDGNGFISAAELRLVLESVGDKFNDAEMEVLIREADRNGDGRIDYTEFAQLAKQT